MLTMLSAITLVAFLYGFAWHNQPARERGGHHEYR